MKKSATKLMKELKYITLQLKQIETNDQEESFIPVDEEYKPLYKSSYSYSKNREEMDSLYDREREIRNILSQFNSKTKVVGYNITIQEALIQMAQLRAKIKVLRHLASKSQVERDYRGDVNKMAVYDISKAKEDLGKVQNELSDLQIAVDQTNLNSSIDC